MRNGSTRRWEISTKESMKQFQWSRLDEMKKKEKQSEDDLCLERVDKINESQWVLIQNDNEIRRESYWNNQRLAFKERKR